MNHIPILLRSVVIGVAITVIGTLPWVWLLRRNMATTPGVPWAAVVMGAFLAVFAWYLSGHGAPRSTVANRKDSARRFPTRPIWKWGLIAGIFGAFFSEEAWLVSLRYSHLPDGAFRSGLDIQNLPWWSWGACLVMTSLVAGVTEEFGFRGYMQRPLEHRYGPTAAIAVSTLTFFLIHLHHGWVTWTMTIPYVVGGIFFGALAYCGQSIWPGIVVHTCIDIYDLLFEWEIIGSYNLSPPPSSGFDAHILVHAGGIVVFGVASLITMRRLAAVSRASTAGAVPPPSVVNL